MAEYMRLMAVKDAKGKFVSLAWGDADARQMWVFWQQKYVEELHASYWVVVLDGCEPNDIPVAIAAYSALTGQLPISF